MNITHVVSPNYIQFIQGFWSSLCWRQACIDVHLKPNLRHLQRPGLHCCSHAQQIISRQLSGIWLRDTRIGFCPNSSRFHPISTGAGRSGMAQWAFFSILWLIGSNGNEEHHLSVTLLLVYISLGEQHMSGCNDRVCSVHIIHSTDERLYIFDYLLF